MQISIFQSSLWKLIMGGWCGVGSNYYVMSNMHQSYIEMELGLAFDNNNNNNDSCNISINNIKNNHESCKNNNPPI